MAEYPTLANILANPAAESQRESSNVEDRRGDNSAWFEGLIYTLGLERTANMLSRLRSPRAEWKTYPYDDLASILKGPHQDEYRPIHYPEYPQEKADNDWRRDAGVAGSPEIIASSMDKSLANQLGIAKPGVLERWLLQPMGGHMPLSQEEKLRLERNRLSGGAGNAPY